MPARPIAGDGTGRWNETTAGWKGTIMNTLAKWNPFSRTDELDMLRPALRMDPFRDMEDLVRGMQRAFAAWPAKSQEAMTLADWVPSVDIGENDKEFLVKAELPEVKKEDIKVNVDDGTLTISGERKVEKEEKGMKFHRVERAYGRFERAFSLPEQTDAAHITSEYKDGILTVHLPKNPKAKPAAQAIPVN
jgi:HSP20 family protein